MWELNQVGFDINNLKISLHIFVISEYQNSVPQLFECLEHMYYGLIFHHAK